MCTIMNLRHQNVSLADVAAISVCGVHQGHIKLPLFLTDIAIAMGFTIRGEGQFLHHNLDFH